MLVLMSRSENGMLIIYKLELLLFPLKVSISILNVKNFRVPEASSNIFFGIFTFYKFCV